MKRKIFISVLLLGLIGSASAQQPLADIIFGLRDGDSAGILYAYEDSPVEVDVWMRTAPGISITGIHIPLSSQDSLIASRDSVNYDYPPIFYWDYFVVLVPNADQQNQEYTNQSVLGICCDGPPEYERGIATEGEWSKISTYFMTPADDLVLDVPFCSAFIEGHHPENGGLVISDYQIGELDPSTYTVQYSCLEFIEDICGPYVVGDYNGSGSLNIADMIDMWSKLRSGGPTFSELLCECPSGAEPWAVRGDVNGSCTFNVADYIALWRWVRWRFPELTPCPQCPPSGR